MPPKKKNVAQKAVTLTDDQQQSIFERMSNKPCINCTDNHEAYDCKKLTGPVSMMSWIYTAFTKAPTLTAARKYIKKLQDEKNGVPNPTTDASSTSTTDALPTTMNELSLASTTVKPPVQEPMQPSVDPPVQSSVEPPIQSFVQAPVQPSVQPKLRTDASGTYFDPEIAYAAADQSGPSPDLLKVSSISMEEPVDIKSHPSERAPHPNSVGGGNVFQPKFRPITAADTPFPLRKALTPAQTQVLTNHFEVKFKPGTRFFVYQIVGVPTGRSKRKTKLIIKTAIQAWDFLRENQDSFAKDNNGLIIAWKNLHDALGVPDHVGENKGYHYTGEVEVAGDEWNGTHIADGFTEFALKFQFLGEMDLENLQAYTDPGRKHNYGDLPKFNFVSQRLICLKHARQS
jgi:eukaryotic translation initiation factor 2C